MCWAIRFEDTFSTWMLSWLPKWKSDTFSEHPCIIKQDNISQEKTIIPGVRLHNNYNVSVTSILFASKCKLSLYIDLEKYLENINYLLIGCICIVNSILSIVIVKKLKYVGFNSDKY